VVIVAGALEFCDCSGLSVLLATTRTARALGTDLRLRAVSGPLARTMLSTGTCGAFNFDT
jgi:anti-sigma B factor antagonist